MRPQVKDIRCSNLDDPEMPQPIPPEEFCYFFELDIGPPDSEGADTFYVAFCSLKWVEGFVKRNGSFSKRGHVIVERYDFKEFKTWIDRWLDLTYGKTWEEIYRKLLKFADSEYDD